MAGRMAAKRAPLPPYLAGAASDTGNIMGHATRTPAGNTIPLPRPAPRPYRPPPRPVTMHRDVARAQPILRPPPPPKPPPPPPPLPDRQADWWGRPGSAAELLGSPQARAQLAEKRSGVKVLGEGPEITKKDKESPLNDMRNLPWGAVADTANILQGTEKDPNQKKNRKFKLAEDDNPKVESDIWAGMGPDERADYTQLRAVIERGILVPGTDVFSDVERSLHNVVVQAQYRALITWASQKQAMAGEGPTGSEYGGFFDANVLGGGEQNLYTPNVVLWWDEESGMYSIMTKAAAVQQMIVDAKRLPDKAGKLITALLRAEIIPGASKQYAEQYLRFDADGNIIGTWPTEYDDLVSTMVDRIAADQFADKAPDHFVDGVWESVLRQGDQNTAVMDDPALSDTGYGAGGGGGGGRGGGGGFGGFGGGGGGGAGSIFHTDPAVIGSELNNISRARLGRALSPEEQAEFVAHFHALETAYSNAYNARAGGVLTQPDLEGQIVAWIESRFRLEQNQETAGEYVSALAAFLRGPGLGSGGG